MEAPLPPDNSASHEHQDSRTFPWYKDRALLLLLVLAFAKLMIHLVANATVAYGYFRDELYYVACANHPALGYVDQPPFSIFLLGAWKSLFGVSLFSLHFPPALAGAATVFLAGLIARELGGGLVAQGMASLVTLVSPVYFSIDSSYSMNSLDVLVWTLAAYLLVRIIKTEDRRLWLALGLLLGIGLLNKISVFWLGAGIAAGMVFSPLRRWLTTPWPWTAGAIALILFSPFVIWNMQHDFAHLEFIRNASLHKYGGLTPGGFLADQFMQNHPLAAPLWILGLSFYFLPGQRQFRCLGVIYATTLAILIVNGHSKAEYLSPAYAMLFAGGSVLFARLTERHGARWLRPSYGTLLLAGGLATAPLATPLLPVETYISYAAALGTKPGTSEGKTLGRLPQFFADMFGWKEKAEAVASVYSRLSPGEKNTCAVYAQNYGECAAIDFFGKKYGLPPAMGRHNNYWIWGPHGSTGDVVIVLGKSAEDERRSFDSVAVADTVRCAYCMPYENNLLVMVCRGLKEPIDTLWPKLKLFI